VRIEVADKASFVINDKSLNEYLPTAELQRIALEAFEKDEAPKLYAVSVKVLGGGIASQAVAIRHGISRALTELNEELRKPLKKAGFLKRDPRAKERRKFGLKKARKAPQWSKR
jgi:small subunit ribosomal protein S9